MRKPRVSVASPRCALLHRESWYLVPWSEACNHWANERIDIITQADFVEVFDNYRVAGKKIHLDQRDVILTTVLTHHRMSFAEVWPCHGWKKMVFNLIVETAHEVIA